MVATRPAAPIAGGGTGGPAGRERPRPPKALRWTHWMRRSRRWRKLALRCRAAPPMLWRRLKVPAAGKLQARQTVPRAVPASLAAGRRRPPPRPTRNRRPPIPVPILRTPAHPRKPAHPRNRPPARPRPVLLAAATPMRAPALGLRANRAPTSRSNGRGRTPRRCRRRMPRPRHQTSRCRITTDRRRRRQPSAPPGPRWLLPGPELRRA